MLKETFKMRKIGKHLVNVSMLSLAIAPVVGSALAPVTVLAAEKNEVRNDTAPKVTKRTEKIPFKTEKKKIQHFQKAKRKSFKKVLRVKKSM